MNSKKNNFVDFIVSLVLLIPGFFISGWALSTIWNFWIYPVFGICLNVFSGGGISLFISFISTKMVSVLNRDEDTSTLVRIIALWIAEALIVFLNWIIFIMFGQFV